MVVSRLGVQPSQTKIEAVAKLTRAKPVEEVMSLLGMGSYLRKFVPGYSSIVAHISDLLRDKRFASKRARRLPVAKMEAVAKLSRGETVEEVMSLLGMGSYVWKFVPGYSSIVAHISDLLRNKRFASKRARRLPVPWGGK